MAKISMINNGFLVELAELKIEFKITLENKKWTTRIFKESEQLEVPIPSPTSPWIPNRNRDRIITDTLKKLDLSEEDVNKLWKEIIIGLDKEKEAWLSRSSKEESDEAAQQQHELQQIERFRKKALHILKNENPLKFIVNANLKRHKGDVPLLSALNLSFPAILVKALGNRFIIGPPDKGKSDACNEVGKTLPFGYYESLIGSSAKSKVYAVMEDDTALKNKIFYYDDTKNDDPEFRRLIRVIKDLRPGEIKYYETVIEQRPVKIKITGNCCVWESSVNAPKDKQDYSRALICKVEETKKHAREIEIKSRELQGKDIQESVPEEYLIIKAIWYVLLEQNIPGVVIPYWGKIAGVRGGRSNKLFMGLIKGHTVLNYFQRAKDKDGKIIANAEDFNVAKNIYLSFTPKKNLSDQEKTVFNYLPEYRDAEETKVDINLIATILNVSYPRASGILNSLAVKDFVSFTPDPNDYRHKFWYKLDVGDNRVWLLEDGEEEPLER